MTRLGSEFRSTFTAAHSRMIDILQANGIQVEPEVPFPCREWVPGHALMRMHPYQVDIYLPESHVAVEVDGVSHANRSKRDAKRDAMLLDQHKLPILRIRNESVPMAGPLDGPSALIVGKWVLDFMMEHATTAGVRRGS